MIRLTAYELKPYEFSGDITRKVIANMARTPRFMAKNRDVLAAELFSDKRESLIAQLLLEFYDSYHEAPSRSSFFQLLADKLKELASESHGLYIAMATQVYDDQALLIDSEYVTKQAVDWGKRQKFVQNLLEAGTDLGSGVPIEDLKKKMLKACRLGEGTADIGSFFARDSAARFFKREMGDEVKRIPTGISLLDSEFLDGGMRPGELFMVVAKYGTYKSTILCNIAAWNYILNHKVAYYTLEMSEDRVLTRIDARLTGISTSQLNEGGHYGTWARRAIELQYRAHTADVAVKFYPTKSASVMTIRSHLSMLYDVHGFKPDLVVVDYLGLLKSSMKGGERWERLADSGEELRGLGGELEIPVFSAHQLSRAGGKAKAASGSDTAGSIEIPNISDVLVIPSQTQEEKELGKFRLLIDKNRNNKSGKTLLLSIDADRMLIGAEASIEDHVEE
jgi:replicative DNA helicase